MIRYALRCAKGHAFESWFQSSSAYDSQRKRRLVTCPICDSHEVEKAIMAPRVARKGRKAAVSAPEEQAATPPAPAPQPEAAPLMMAQEQELRAKLRELRDAVLKTADNVGERFPEEARKMHYGDIDHRPIYGTASRDEAEALIDEGIEVAPIPVLPEDRN